MGYVGKNLLKYGLGDWSDKEQLLLKQIINLTLLRNLIIINNAFLEDINKQLKLYIIFIKKIPKLTVLPKFLKLQKSIFH